LPLEAKHYVYLKINFFLIYSSIQKLFYFTGRLQASVKNRLLLVLIPVSPYRLFTQQMRMAGNSLCKAFLVLSSPTDSLSFWFQAWSQSTIIFEGCLSEISHASKWQHFQKKLCFVRPYIKLSLEILECGSGISIACMSQVPKPQCYQ